jgi:hypothetical protein
MGNQVKEKDVEEIGYALITKNGKITKTVDGMGTTFDIYTKLGDAVFAAKMYGTDVVRVVIKVQK